MVTVGLTFKLVPEPASVPPQLTVYQSTVHPPATDADRVDDWPTLIVDGVAVTPVGALGTALTVTDVVTHDELPQPFIQRA